MRPANNPAPRAQPATRVTTGRAGGLPRTAPCPCGSSLRYKHCCGKLAHAAPAPAPADTESYGEFSVDDAIVRHAGVLLASGEANKTAELLAQLRPARVRNATLALEAGHLYLEMHLLDPARALLQRAVELSGRHPRAVAAYDECCHLIERASAWEAAGRTLRVLLDRLNARARAAPVAASAYIHIVCKLDTIGGTERRALNLYRCLSGAVHVTLWSAEPALPLYSSAVPIRRITAGDAPAGGTLVLVGTYFACGDWLETAAFDRVILCHNLTEQYHSLTQRLIQIEKNLSFPTVELTFPSKLFKQIVGLEGRVEYSAVDVDTFDIDALRRRAPRAAPPAPRTTGLTIGRHGRAHPLKFHPNDPSFFRALMARGHQIAILGGTVIAPAFARDSEPLPELLAVGTERAEDFLARLDLFVYRKHPELFETGGTTILEAMAMARPVIVFAEQCGAAELIAHGDNGFIVDGEAHAIELIEHLGADPALRERVGRSARTTIVELMRRQTAATLDYYLGRPEGKP